MYYTFKIQQHTHSKIIFRVIFDIMYQEIIWKDLQENRAKLNQIQHNLMIQEVEENILILPMKTETLDHIGDVTKSLFWSKCCDFFL